MEYKDVARQRQIKLDLTYGRHCSKTFEVLSFRGDKKHTDEIGYSAWISKKFKMILYQSLLKNLHAQEIRGQIFQ